LYSGIVSAQKKITYNVESNLVTSSGNTTAFWAISNKYGTVSANPNSAQLRSGIFAEFDTSRYNKLDYSWGLDVINRFDNDYHLFFHQYYLKLKYSFLTLQGGRIEEYLGNQDSTLSSGGLLWSGNAPPMPKITIGILNYTPVPFTNGFFEFKGALSHGWFDKDSYVKNEWLHHKYIYLRAGGNLPVKFNYGFHHFVQWGGVSPEAGRLPSSFKDYLIIFVAKQLDTAGISQGNSGLFAEYLNRIGNHLGMRDMGIDVNFNKFDAGIYFQSYYEDNSSLHWHNLPDGLYGIYLKPKKIEWLKDIVYEYVATTNQCEPYRSHTIYPGSDNLFNNGDYRSGWTYNDFTIGTPLITSPVLLKRMNTPDYNFNDYLRNNRILAHHLGCRGIVNKINYNMLLTYTKNYGTYAFPFPYIRESVSTYLELSKKLARFYNFEVSVAIAKDFGSMYGNKETYLLTLRKNGKLF
jgi:hypothetical protein